MAQRFQKWRTSRWHELKKWLAPSSGEGRHIEEERIRRRSESVSDMGKKKLKSTGKGRHKEEERKWGERRRGRRDGGGGRRGEKVRR